MATRIASISDLEFPALPGAYLLVLRALAPVVVFAGRLGVFTLPPGLYGYVGSARGPGGLAARLARHQRAQKRQHWHVDALTALLPIVAIRVIVAAEPMECAWVQRLLAAGARTPIPGFGSSDCRAGCPAHLLRLPDAGVSFQARKHTERVCEPTCLTNNDQSKDAVLCVGDWMMPSIQDHTGDVLQALLAALDDADDAAAEAAAQACTGRSDLAPALRPLLADKDPDRRWWAVRILALIGGPQAAALAEAHLADPDEATRCAAALALGHLAASASVPALAAALADQSGWVRDSAADALAMIGEPALPALVTALTDARDGVRVRASTALRKLVAPALAGLNMMAYPPQFRPAINTLFQALNDPNRLVRHNAYEALTKLGLLETVLLAP